MATLEIHDLHVTVDAENGVKEILRGGVVPHVFATGDALRDLSLGPNAVLIQKPFRGPDIVHAIERALAARPAGAGFAPVIM